MSISERQILGHAKTNAQLIAPGGEQEMQATQRALDTTNNDDMFRLGNNFYRNLHCANATTWTAGSVGFVDDGGKEWTHDNANLFWEKDGARLGIGTNTIAAQRCEMQIASAGLDAATITNSILRLENTLAGDAALALINNSISFGLMIDAISATFAMYDYTNAVAALSLHPSSLTMRTAATYKIGIGTDSVDNALAHLYFNAASNHQTRAGAMLLLENPTEDTNGHAGIAFQAGTDDEYDWFSMYADWNGGDPRFVMYDPTNGVEFIEYHTDDYRVTIGSNVGVAGFRVNASSDMHAYMEFGGDVSYLGKAALFLGFDSGIRFDDCDVEIAGYDGDILYHFGYCDDMKFVYSNNELMETPVSGRLMQYVYEDAVTDAITWMARYTHLSTGDVVVGFGGGIEMELENHVDCEVNHVGGLSYEYNENYMNDITEQQWRFWLDGDGTKYSALTISGSSEGPGGGYPFVRAGLGSNWDNPGVTFSGAFSIFEGNGESVFHVQSQTGGFGACIIEGNTGAWSYWIDNGGSANDRILALEVDGGVGVFQSVNDNATTLKDNMLAFDLSTGYVGIGLNNPAAPLEVSITTADRETVTALRLSHLNTDEGEDEGGVQIEFYAELTAGCFIEDVFAKIEGYATGDAAALNFYVGNAYNDASVDKILELDFDTSILASPLTIETVDATQAVPVLTMTQLDVSEEFIRFVGTAASATLTQSIVDVGDVTTPTLVGYLKVYVQDDGNQVTDGAYFIPFYSIV
jgi:hypothetical protein